MRILIRTSRLAIWARRLASFAVPLVVVPVLLLRMRLIELPAFNVIEIGGGVIAALSVLLALAAFVRLWNTGDQGWGRALAALGLGTILLLPFAWFGSLALRYPDRADVSTDPAQPPVLVEAVGTPAPLPAGQAAIVASFPNVKTRRYPLTPDATFALVEKLAADNDWSIVRLQRPGGGAATGVLNAVAATVLGWRDEVAVRVIADTAGSVVDMRSAALGRSEDFGGNGQRVEQFLLALDAAVTSQRLNAPASAPEPADIEGGNGTGDAEG